MRHPPARAVPWGWGATGAWVGAVIALVLWAPARWLGDALAWASGERVQLQQAQGTVWNGTAQLVLASGDLGVPTTALPGSLSWSLRPRWNGLQLTLRSSCCLDTDWPWHLRLRSDSVVLEADNLDTRASHWPAPVLAGLGTPWNTLQLRGSLALSTQDFSIRLQRAGWTLAGQATIDAWGMGTALSTLQPVGSYRLALAGGEQPTLTLSTLGGPLQLSGQGQRMQGRWRFAGEARADEASQAALGNLLNIIGRREGARSIITVG